MDVKEFCNKAYQDAVQHGWHNDRSLTNEHYIMLIITELSECIEADRKNLHANLKSFLEETEKVTLDSSGGKEFWAKQFHKYIKDSFEDELADVAIRAADLAGLRGVNLTDSSKDTHVDLSYSNFSELCFYEVYVILSNYSHYGLSVTLSDILWFCMKLSELKCIDLSKHIELKMQYNKLRPYMNNKKY